MCVRYIIHVHISNIDRDGDIFSLGDDGEAHTHTCSGERILSGPT